MSEFGNLPNDRRADVNWAGVVITIAALVLIASAILYLIFK